jgi:hypothetical protein
MYTMDTAAHVAGVLRRFLLHAMKTQDNSVALSPQQDPSNGEIEVPARARS